MNRESRFIQNTQTVFRKEDLGAYLYDPDSGKLKYLNPVGTSIYELCDGRHPVQEMITRMADQYEDVQPVELEKDIERFLESLLQMDYIRRII